MEIVNCVKCNSEFLAYPSRVLRGDAKYCSAKCGRPGKVEVICANCEKKTLRFPAHLRKRKRPFKRLFCSRRCRLEWYRPGAKHKNDDCEPPIEIDRMALKFECFECPAPAPRFKTIQERGWHYMDQHPGALSGCLDPA